MQFRTDNLRIKGRVRKTDEGYLDGDAIITRTGVFVYRNPLTGQVVSRELRHPDDVFKKDSLDTLKMVPITNRHPNTDVNAKNAKRFTVGTTGENVRHDSQDVMNNIKITDQQTIQDIENGRQELSAGYFTNIIKEDGIYNGEKYDHRQTDIRYNHVAVTEKGRAGESVRLNFDSIDEISDEDILEYTESTKQSEVSMVKLKIDSCEYDVPQEVLNHVNKQNSQIQSLTGERDGFKLKCDAFEKLDINAEIAAGVKERKEVEAAATSILGKDFKTDGLDNKAIKEAIIKKCSPDLKLDSESEDYLDGFYKASVSFAQNKLKEDAAAKNRKQSTIPQSRGDGKDEQFSSSSARDKMIERNLNSYRRDGK